MITHIRCLLLIPLLLAGCSVLATPGPTPVLEALTSQPDQSSATNPNRGREPAPTALVEAGTPSPVRLNIWLPPQFDPASGAPAAKLLEKRLKAFQKENPEVRIKTRIKAEEGPGGMYDSLATASAAAQLALPDLVALPHPLLQQAALKGLLHPMPGIETMINEEDWYPYAGEMAHAQDSPYGLPFAGDALALAYRPEGVETPPADWSASLQLAIPLLFPAADPGALFTLASYQANQGEIYDEQERPILQAGPLTQVLTYFQQAERTGFMPFSLSQYDSYEQTWNAYQQGQADLAATWLSSYLATKPPGTSVTSLPTPDGSFFTLATGWVWALASPDPQRQELATSLAEYLTEPSFLAEWSQAAGYLPPRPSALKAWDDPSLRSILNLISLSAQLYPPADVMNSLGPALSEATLQILKGQSSPASAARIASESLSAP